MPIGSFFNGPFLFKNRFFLAKRPLRVTLGLIRLLTCDNSCALNHSTSHYIWRYTKTLLVTRTNCAHVSPFWNTNSRKCFEMAITFLFSSSQYPAQWWLIIACTHINGYFILPTTLEQDKFLKYTSSNTVNVFHFSLKWSYSRSVLKKVFMTVRKGFVMTFNMPIAWPAPVLAGRCELATFHCLC